MQSKLHRSHRLDVVFHIASGFDSFVEAKSVALELGSSIQLVVDKWSMALISAVGYTGFDNLQCMILISILCTYNGSI